MPNNSVIDPVVVNTISEIETVIEPSAPRSFNVVEIEALRTVIVEQPSVIVEVETPVTPVEVLLKDIEVVRVEAGLPGRPGSGAAHVSSDPGNTIEQGSDGGLFSRGLNWETTQW